MKGVPAYKLARKGQKPALKEKSVEIKELGLLDFSPPELTLRATVSSGTYIRVLAEDIGKELGVGAYTKKLIRTRVGKFNLENSKTLEELREYYTNKN